MRRNRLIGLTVATRQVGNTQPAIGVIFDMDGVLVDSARPHFRSWQMLAEENGAVVTPDQFSETFGRQNHDIIPILFGKVSDARMQTLANRKEKIFRTLFREEPPVVDGAVELVRELHDAGARLAVGSSGPRANIELMLGAMRIADLIPVVVSADDVTRGKPDPQVFSLASDRLGLPAARCIVIEDAPVGIQAAQAAGAYTVAVLIHHPVEAFQQADLVVRRLADLSAVQLLSLVG